MPATFIICPAGLVTGGPELLHQLAATLRDNGREAHIVYHPFDARHATPPPYAKYAVAVAKREDIAPNDAVILPEVYTSQAHEFPGARVFLWWLSVDNFRLGLGAARAKRVIPRIAIPLVRALARRLRFLHRIPQWLGRRGGLETLPGVHAHLYQSVFARMFLEQHGLAPTAPLGDYINDDYRRAIGHPSSLPRENLIVFNPLKGPERTDMIVAELVARQIDAKAIPLKGYTRDEVRNLLSRAKLYIDFGNHPGKDRIPREAAAMGACIIVNRRGSAGNAIDVPLPDEYKVDDEREGFAEDTCNKIQAVLNDFETHSRRFEGYRAHIASEHDAFVRQALDLFG